jgi:DNA primase
MRFPPEFIDRLKNHLPLSEVIGRRVPLKRQGREFSGLCPFHKEKSPSFTVNDEKSFFHCFGCGAHGDAIGFIKDYERVEYREAVERLAAEAGLPVPQMTREAVEAERKRHTLEDVVAIAAAWFTEQLYAPIGREAREYLRERGMRLSTAERFGLGFAPNMRDGLKSALMKQDLKESMLIEAGLLARPDEGATYDRFRARLIFPIRNAQGKTVAFGGRILPQAKQDNIAKYLNSPETPLFKKGEMLFAYDIARKAAIDGEPLIVSEGYMDVIALHQAGFTTAVAPLGTAVTEAQLKLLWRVSPEPVFCLDSDAAGKSAAMRAIDVALPLLKPEHSLKVALLPKGEDPDSLIHKKGRDAMVQTLKRAKILSQALWESALQFYGSESAEKKAALEHHLTQAANRIAEPAMRQHMLSYFRDQIYGLRRQKKSEKPAPNRAVPDVLPDVDDDNSRLKRLEEQIVALVLLHPDILHQSEIEEHFGHMDFTQPMLDKLRAHTLEISADTPSLDAAALKTALSSRGHAEKVETLLHSKNATTATMFQSGTMDNTRSACHAFELAYGAYTMRKLEHEMHEAARTMEHDMSEQSYNRFLALQKQLGELRRTRYSARSDEQIS